MYLGDQLNDFPSFLATLENDILDILKFLPDSIYKSLSSGISETFNGWIEGSNTSLAIDTDTIKSGITTGVSGVYSVVKNIPSVLLGVVIGIIAWIFFTKDYNRIVRFIQNQLPAGKKNTLVEFKQVFNKTILKMLKAYGLIMCITFIELFLGFAIMSMLGIMHTSYYALIAVGTAIFDILPVAGSGGVLIPWALISLVTGDYKQAIGLIIIYFVITAIRQYIEPKIVGSSLGVHPIVTLMGLYFGFKLFGFIGMFIVPLTVMTLKALNDNGRISLWKTTKRN
jgi:sporulation integral membrane protein YtvI